MTRSPRLLAALFGVVFFVAHLRTLPRTLEDIDSINFALGVESFDVAAHRPHPPGYPVFIALGKVATVAIHAIVPSWDRDHAAASSLAIWGILAGALAPLALYSLWSALGLSPGVSLLAAALAVCSPLFWFTASRPLTDTVGLVAAIAVQALLLTSEVGLGERPQRWRLFGAFLAGVIVGLRSQTLWLTGPLLAYVVVRLVMHRRVSDAAKLIAAAAIGVVLWLVPLVIVTGGFGRYMDAVSAQGQQDLSGIELLSTTPTWTLLTASLRRSFLDPWHVKNLGNAVMLLAIAGAIRSMWQSRRTFALVLVAFVPYLVFHLLFQETITLRYSLPLVVPAAGLAVMALATSRARVATVVVGALVVVSLVAVQPPIEVYAKEGAPVLRAYEDMIAARRNMPVAPLLHMHHAVWWGVQRAQLWYQPQWDVVGPAQHPGDHEWLGVVRAFAGGRTGPIWFLSDVARSDMRMFDPRTTALRGRYEPPIDMRRYMTTAQPGSSGFRLDALSWWTLDPPAWMLGTGWSVTGESAGITSLDRTGPNLRGAEAFVRRQSTPMRVLVGGRYVGASSAPNAGPIVVAAELDGRPLAQWTVQRDRMWFVDWIDLPAGVPAGDGAYATLTLRATSATPGFAALETRLEQFDAATVDQPIIAFRDDWQEQEQDGVSGRMSRWSSARSTIEIRGGARDVMLVLSGENPLKNYDHAPVIIVRAANVELARFTPGADFAQQVPIPMAALAAASGLVTIETNLTFVPHQKNVGVADSRTLGIRFFDVTVK